MSTRESSFLESSTYMVDEGESSTTPSSSKTRLRPQKGVDMSTLTAVPTPTTVAAVVGRRQRAARLRHLAETARTPNVVAELHRQASAAVQPK